MNYFIVQNLVISVTFKLLQLHVSDVFSFFKILYIPHFYVTNKLVLSSAHAENISDPNTKGLLCS